MKEILQTKAFKQQTSVMYLKPCAYASFHVDHVTKEQLAIKGVEAEVEHLEEQPQEEEYVGEEQDLQANFANTDMQQGKPRFIDPMSYKFKFMQAPESFQIQCLIYI